MRIDSGRGPGGRRTGRGDGRGNGGGYGGRRGRRHGGSRAARVLSRDELALLLLSMVDGTSRHGYELIRTIKSLSRGTYVPSSGMVYPALADLAENGLTAASQGDGGRKLYCATDAGLAEAGRRQDEIAALRDRLMRLDESDDAQPASVDRALANLDLVLANVLRPGSDADAAAIVELIDSAARQIELLGE